jgi:hypothetical protein
MKSLRDLKVISIDLKKYNDSQLEVISKQLCEVNSLKMVKFLSTIKKSGVVRTWYLPEMDEFICNQYDKKMDDLGLALYNNMVFNENIKMSLSKKDKDFLLKMKPTVFDTKVRKAVVKESIVEKLVDIEVVKLPIVLEVDVILDKISRCGINSITKEEKDFLDNLN